MSVNIAAAGGIHDPHFRYRMPRLAIKGEGKRNGVKTVLTNLAEIGRSLNRPPNELLHYFSKDLGVRAECKDKFVLRGEHTASALQNRLLLYIETFVLCSTCGNPETEYKVKPYGKNYNILLVCAACGSKNMIDMQHSLESSLCKQIAKEFTKVTKGEVKNGRLRGRDPKRDRHLECEAREGSGSKEASNSKIAVVKQELRQSSAETTSLVVADIQVKDQQDVENKLLPQAIRLFQVYVATEAESSALLAEAIRIQTMYGFPSGTHVEIIVRGLFNARIREQIKSRVGILHELCQDCTTSTCLICSLEILTLEHPNLVASFPLILKDMYDEDVLEEEFILDWGKRSTVRIEHSSSHLSNNQLEELLQNSKPLIRWLENAEVDDE